MAAGILTAKVFVWTVTCGIILSFVLAAFLFVRCLLYLWRTGRRIGGRRLLVKHIAGIAGADACMAAWSYFGSALHSHSFLVRGDPSWCNVFTTVRMWLILLSALWTGALALGTLAALLGRARQVRLLGYTTAGVVPVSLVLCAYNIFEPCHIEVAYDGSVDCEQSELAISIECAEQALILVFVASVFCFARHRRRNQSPTSTESRSIRIVSRYLIAYMMSYGCWVVARWPQLNRLWHKELWWQIFVSLAWRLLVLNGAFNFVALWMHADETVVELTHPGVHVQLLGDTPAATIKVQRVDHRSLERTVKAELAEIQNSNQRLWKELGLTYEQGVTGQLEPLSEEERADHFYSILNCSSKLQRATVI